MEKHGFGRLLSVWTVRMPSGEPLFLSRRSSFSPWSVALTSGLFFLTQSHGVFFLTRRESLFILTHKQEVAHPHAEVGSIFLTRWSGVPSLVLLMQRAGRAASRHEFLLCMRLAVDFTHVLGCCYSSMIFGCGCESDFFFHGGLHVCFFPVCMGCVILQCLG